MEDALLSVDRRTKVFCEEFNAKIYGTLVGVRAVTTSLIVDTNDDLDEEFNLTIPTTAHDPTLPRLR
jgi:hypothetical protein